MSSLASFPTPREPWRGWISAAQWQRPRQASDVDLDVEEDVVALLNRQCVCDRGWIVAVLVEELDKAPADGPAAAFLPWVDRLLDEGASIS